MRVIKPSEKFRFNFDWDTTEDTSRDVNLLYQNPHEAQLLFGRGFHAGIDRREQKKKDGGVPEDAADRLYDTFDMKIHRHWSDKKLEDMTERDWRIFREDFNISYKGSKISMPMRNWHESKLHSTELLKAVEKQRDVIGIAQTGSGKTAAFVLPMLNADDGPYAVVMARTRELAQQIEKETVNFEQESMVRKGCEVIIATPGRLGDCLKRRSTVLKQCHYVVLDEADHMIDMNFESQVMDVLDAMPSSNLKPDNEDEELYAKRIYRTSYMFSATLSSAVERLAKKYLRNPVVVTIGTAGKATELITQKVTMIKETEKFGQLHKMLIDLHEKMAINGYRVTVLHGDISQDQQENSLERFMNRRFNVLVATDVAAHGVDIPDVAHVINYDMPGNIEMYTHHIGRTGRAGKTGVATTFLTLHDTDVFYYLRRAVIQSNSRVPPELARHEAARIKPVDRPHRQNDEGY
ncbi:hypothetical protein MKX01_019766 [Papaver californicum]|nr:hypothetical protein MKX01_019766 [Papaver californicum]